MKLGKAIHNKPMIRALDGKWDHHIDSREVRIMAIAEGFAMVRRKGCMPYVCAVKELEQPTPTPGSREGGTTEDRYC